jgi:hypothetical protein
VTVDVAAGDHATVPVVGIATADRDEHVEQGTVGDVEAQLERIARRQGDNLDTDDHVSELC